MTKQIPYHRIHLTGVEPTYMAEALQQDELVNGKFTQKAVCLLQEMTQASCVFLTNSCTSALEMSALLANIQPGDEVIMPSYTFVSTANAFVLRGAKPVFVDICPDTLNINVSLIEEAITERTRAIVPVHYAGVSCEMEKMNAVATRHGLMVIEDAAQALLSAYKGNRLGSLGALSALSFHYTKNITSGVGGALLINDETMIDRAKVLYQKGTNREAFLEGKVDKYTWVDVGSSFMPSEITAAMLLAQLEQAQRVTEGRLQIWSAYHERLEGLALAGRCRRPVIPADCLHNAHIYYLLLASKAQRSAFMAYMKAQGIDTPFHFVPLHLAPAGERFAGVQGQLLHTEQLAERLVRLPLYPAMASDVDYICDCIEAFFVAFDELFAKKASIHL